MRICNACGATFSATGNNYRCPPCRRAYDVAWRAARKASGNPVIPAKMPREYHRAYEAEYFTRPENRERRNAQMRHYSKGPLRSHHEARWAVRRALKANQLMQSPCEVCGDPKTQAHHEDYSKPLDVRWLCRVHHVEVHAKAEGRS